MVKSLKKSVIFLLIVVTAFAMVTNVAFAANTDTLNAGATLQAGQSITSANGQYTAIMQTDGNFVVYRGSSALFATMTQGSNYYFAFQTDGNLVVYNQSSKVVWSPNVHGKGATKLVLQNDGNLVAYTATGTAVWASAVVIGNNDTLFTGQTLRSGQSLTSTNGRLLP